MTRPVSNEWVEVSEAHSIGYIWAELFQEIPKGKGRKKFKMKEFGVRKMDTNEIKINETGQVD